MPIRRVACVLLALTSFLPLISQEKQKIPVKIGLLIQTEYSDDARNGAELAAVIVNNSGGVNGRTLQIIVKSMEGPWGTGSNRAASLIFDDEVIAVVGSTDGRNGHLVEQACTKTQVLFISCLSADPTLAQAFVPWFFNMVPNDLQQSQVLADDIFKKNKYGKVATVTGSDYDSKNALKYFNRLYPGMNESKVTLVRNFELQRNMRDYSEIINRLTDFAPDCIVFFCTPETAAPLLNEIKKRKPDVSVYGNTYLAAENRKKFEMIEAKGYKIKIPFPVRSEEKHIWFREIYRKRYNTSPGVAAEFTFDTITMIAKALSVAGAERISLQNYLMNNSFEGITGLISFDERGNRKGPFRIIEF